MAAIVKQESGFKPFSIGVNGAYILKRQPKTKKGPQQNPKGLAEVRLSCSHAENPGNGA
jgi:hypothetical protein